MDVKHSLSLGVLGKFADRFHQYQKPRSLEERLRVVHSTPGADGAEIVYPQDFDVEKPESTIALIRETGVTISAVNVNLKSEEKWRFGSLTAPDPDRRKEAVRYIQVAMELAEELGCYLVTCCPLIDGWDYNFQVDYDRMWGWLLEGLAAASEHRPNVRLSLEYKPYESKNFIVLSDMGHTLYLCEKVGASNLGITLDFGHALVAGETPAAEVALALKAQRLFYLHFNDNNRIWDWDMLPATINLWDLVETLFYLERAQWNGWFAYDVHTREGDPDQTVAAAVRIMRILIAWVEERREFLAELVAEPRVADVFPRLIKELFGRSGR